MLRFSSREQEHDGERVGERHLGEFVGKGPDDRQVAGVDRPLDPKPDELTTSDGRKFKVKVPGLAPPPKPGRTEERGSAEPPREDPRPLINPDHIGP